MHNLGINKKPTLIKDEIMPDALLARFIDIQGSSATLRWRFFRKNRLSVVRPRCMTDLRGNRWAVVLFAILLSGVGCSSSSDESPRRPSVSKSPAAAKSASARELVSPPKLPVAEFQHAAPLPPSEAVPEPSVPPAVPPSARQAEEAVSEQASPPSTPRKPLPGKHSGIPFDPIKENGPIFVDWPKPKLALVITGMEHGYLEPCGCAGLDRMRGGMGRRHTFFQQIRQAGWPVVALDVGGLARGFGRQAELKFQTMIEGKRKMQYDAIAFGIDDLRLPAGELVAAAASIDGKPSLFVAANVGLFGFAAEITPKSRIIEAGGMKVGVTAVLGKRYQEQIHNDEIEMTDPEAALKPIVAELKQKTDYRVLLAHATLDEAVALAKGFPEFNVVVASNGSEVPPAAPQTVPGTNTLLITVGHKGMDLVVLGLFDDKSVPFRYQRVPLDSRFAASPDMKMLMTALQDQLKLIGFEGLGLRPVPHPLAEANGAFVGSHKCQSCHEKSYDIWKKTGHARAYDTLAKLDPPRNFDPECVSCHVIGWHPTSYFPYEGGYESLEKTPKLIDVGCEDCHGPGEKHIAAEMGSNEELQKKYRQAVVITKEQSKKQQCMTCHDLDNSPDFNFDLYWPYVEHYEKEE